jgi:hypothetical protein
MSRRYLVPPSCYRFARAERTSSCEGRTRRSLRLQQTADGSEVVFRQVDILVMHPQGLMLQKGRSKGRPLSVSDPAPKGSQSLYPCGAKRTKSRGTGDRSSKRTRDGRMRVCDAPRRCKAAYENSASPGPHGSAISTSGNHIHTCPSLGKPTKCGSVGGRRALLKRSRNPI